MADLYNKFLIKKDVASKAIEYLKSRGFNQQDIETNQMALHLIHGIFYHHLLKMIKIN